MEIKNLKEKLALLDKYNIDNKENLIENLYKLASHNFDTYVKKENSES
jgi:hypothetical protein